MALHFHKHYQPQEAQLQQVISFSDGATIPELEGPLCYYNQYPIKLNNLPILNTVDNIYSVQISNRLH